MPQRVQKGEVRPDSPLLKLCEKAKDDPKTWADAERAFGLLKFLDGIDQKRWDSFFDVRVVQNVYGKAGQKYDLQKMKLCEYICALPDEACRKIFKNLKSEIEKVSVWFEVE